MKISILIPVHNEAEHLAEMLTSILSQSHTKWEAIVVDDGSADDTHTIANSFAKQDARIRLLPNRQKIGKTAAFNLAFRASSGDLVCFAGGDDTLPPNSLHNRSLLFGSVKAGERAVGYGKLRTFSTVQQYDGLLLPKGRGGSKSGGSITMTRALCARVFPIPEELPSEDLWTRLAAGTLATRELHSDSVFLNYRIHSGNSSQKFSSFSDYDKRTAARQRAHSLFLESGRFDLSAVERQRLKASIELEQLRQGGDLRRIVTFKEAALLDRLAVAAGANKSLYAVRQRLFRFVAGRRGM